MTRIHQPARSSHPARRSVLAGLGLGAAGLALSACGAPGGGKDSVDGTRSGFSQADVKVPAKYKGRTPILFWSPFTGVNFTALQEIFTAFNESQQDIVAIAESQGGYADLNTKFTAALQARSVPDLVCFPERQWLQFFFSDALAPLDPYFDEDWNLDVYLDNYVDEGKASGKTYVVPFARSTPLFYFNRTRYTELGLPPEGPKTWDELASFAPELQKVEVSGKKLAALAFGADDAWFGQAQIWAWGGSNSQDFDVTIGEQPGIDWLSWQRDFIHTKHFGYMAKDAGTDFTTGLTAGMQGSTASLRGLTEEATFDIGTAFMLGKQEEHTACPTGGSGLSIVKAESKERQDACAELLRYLADPEVSARWHQGTGYVPIVKKARDTATVRDLVAQNPNYGVALAQLEYARSADRINWFQAAITEIGQAQARVYGDNADPAAVLKALTPKLQRIMDDNRSDLGKVLQGA